MVRGIGVHNVEAATGCCQLGDEVLGFDRVQARDASLPLVEQRADLPPPPVIWLVDLDARAPAQRFEPHLARAGTQVEEGTALQVGAEHGEYGFFEARGGEADLAQASPGGNLPTAIGASDNAHG